MKSPYDVIIKPVITEKTMAITEDGKLLMLKSPRSRQQLRSSSV